MLRPHSERMNSRREGVRAGGHLRRRVLAFALMAVAGMAAADDRREAVRRIASGLIAPCCFQQTLADHHSEIAERLRAEIADALAQGRSEEQIVAGFVARYGERILATPAPRGFNLLAYVIPPVVVAAGIGVLFVRMRRGVRRAARHGAGRWARSRGARVDRRRAARVRPRVTRAVACSRGEQIREPGFDTCCGGMS